MQPRTLASVGTTQCLLSPCPLLPSALGMTELAQGLGVGWGWGAFCSQLFCDIQLCLGCPRLRICYFWAQWGPETSDCPLSIPWQAGCHGFPQPDTHQGLCGKHATVLPSLLAQSTGTLVGYRFSPIPFIPPCLVPNCWELLRQHYCPDLWIGTPPPRRKEGQKQATDTLPQEQPQIVPALSQRLMSWPQDVPWYRQVPASPSNCLKNVQFYCPTPPADKYLYFPFCFCNSTAPSFLPKGTSPFACAFKPWALLNTLEPWCYSECFHVILYTRFSSLSTPAPQFGS
jgi:hypothetical protein